MASIIVKTGGQTGVDRAVLDHAIATCTPYCGWCPHGGWAEDFPQAPGVLSLYPHLRETPSPHPQQRTAWNVRDSHATLILLGSRVLAESPGTQLTQQLASLVFMKPCLVVDSSSSASSQAAHNWIHHLIAVLMPSPLVLNIAGPRESESPGIYAKAQCILPNILPSP